MNVRDVIPIFYPDSKACLGELVVDGFVHEAHTLTSKITEHPIESGSSIADHVHQEPFALAIEGIISNTPMTLVGLAAFDSARFSCTAKQIKIVQQERISIPEPKVSRAKPKQKQGLQETKPVSPEKAESLKKDRSGIFSIGKWLLGN